MQQPLRLCLRTTNQNMDGTGTRRSEDDGVVVADLHNDVAYDNNNSTSSTNTTTVPFFLPSPLFSDNATSSYYNSSSSKTIHVDGSFILNNTTDTMMITSRSAPEDPAIYRYSIIPSAVLSGVCSMFVIYHSTAVRRTTMTRRRRTSSRRSAGGGAVTTTTTTPTSLRRRPKSTFYRLLFMLCFCDILSSTTITIEQFVTVVEPGHWSCEASGFVKLVGVTCGSGYNAFLSTYFYLVVCRGWREASTIRHFEPYIHCFTVLWTIYLFLGIFLGVYNPGGTGGCWSTPYPPGCQGAEECIRGEPWGWIYDLSTSVGFLMTLTILIVSNTAIYCKVRRREQSARRFRFMGLTGLTGTIATDNGNNEGPTSSAMAVATAATVAETATTTRRPRRWESKFGPCFARWFGINRDSRRPPVVPVGNKTRQVATQSVYYCGGYMAVYLIAFLHGISTGGYQHYNAWWYPIVRIAQEVTFPLQG